MSHWKLTLACLLAAALLAPLSALAADDSPADQPAAASAAGTAQVSPDEIAALVKQLDADKFADRQQASQRLGEIGKPAIGALAEAAAGDSLEVTVRAIDIFKELLESSDEQTCQAAKAGLEKVAKCDRPSAARRAEDALKAFEEKKQATAMQAVPGVIQFGGGGIAIAGGRRVSVRNVNGVKTIEAEEGNEKVKIVEDPKDGIKMEVTTKKDNGKETTEKFEAKNAEELKKKHPEAYKIYSKYANQGGNFVVQLQVGGGAAVPVPVQPRRINQIDSASRILSMWAGQLKRLATDEAIKQSPKASNEELRKTVGEVRKQLADLEKRLDAAIEKSDEQPAKGDSKAEPKEAKPADAAN